MNLIKEDKDTIALNVMTEVVGIIDVDAERVLSEIKEDIKNNVSLDEICLKEHKIIVRYHCWMNPEDFPENDIHWSKIDVTSNVPPIPEEIDNTL